MVELTFPAALLLRVGLHLISFHIVSLVVRLRVNLFYGEFCLFPVLAILFAIVRRGWGRLEREFTRGLGNRHGIVQLGIYFVSPILGFLISARPLFFVRLRIGG